jgi:hypothetical protein
MSFLNIFKKEESALDTAKYISNERISQLLLEILESAFDKKDFKELPFTVKYSQYDLEYIARSLSYLDDERAWKCRNFLLEKQNIGDKNIVMKKMILESLAGVDSSESWKMRNTLSDELVNKHGISTTSAHIPFFDGLMGVNYQDAWLYRNKAIDNELYPVLKSLIGLNNLESNKIRSDYSNKSPTVLSVSGLDSEIAWNIRNNNIEENPQEVLHSLSGLNSKKSWDMRTKLSHRRILDPLDLVKSVIGLDDEKSWKLRHEFWSAFEGGKLDQAKDGILYGMSISIAGLDSANAWKMRQRIVEEGGLRYLPLSINGDCLTSTVWRLKQKSH